MANLGAETNQVYVDLNENVDALIENPLRSLNLKELMEDVERFVEEKELNDMLSEIQRGAYVAKDPKIYEQVARGNISGDGLPVTLSSRERQAIVNEKDALFKQSKDLYITIITCSAAALLQGWDQTGSNSANLFWQKEFALRPGVSRDDWIIGLVNAAPYISSALVGCVLTDPINSRFGRRGTIFFAGLWCFASVIGSAFTHSWQALLATRLCLGIGMGSKASTVAVLAAECAPTYFRGSLVMSWQLWVATGIFLGFSASLMVYQTGSIAWRLMLGSACIPAIPLLILIYIVPESPRWYMKQHSPIHYDKACKSLLRLRNTPLQAYRDFYLAHKQLELETVFIRRQGLLALDTERGVPIKAIGSYFIRFGQLFTSEIPRVRRATIGACSTMLSQQLCGINVLAFYSSTLFSHTDNDVRTALLFSWGFGLINAVFALPAVRAIDTFGRRPLLLISTFNMFWTLLAAGLCFCISEHNSARTGLIAFFLFLFAAAYSPGEGPVPFTYSAEAFPLSHREIGMSISVATNLFFAAVLTVVFPRLNSALGDTGSLGLFAGFNVLAFIMIFLWVPETAQRSLEELSQVFGVPTKKHMKYQITVYLPWFIRHYILFRHVELELLYQEFDFLDEAETEAVELVQQTQIHENKPYGQDERAVEDVDGGDDDVAPDVVVPQEPHDLETLPGDAVSIVSSASSDHS